ncbi:MAG: SUMF1/EgtB/PvdO family nonheme iron enzyme, partial [Planctomycetota bacterium]
AFLDRGIEELSERGKVFPVRLSLFVEMVKAQPWDADTLHRLGGVEGVGLRFLEESFSSQLAPAAQRTHEPAVRSVLGQLLPQAGVDIKGKMQSEDALLEASGYRDQPALFDEMMRILDTDLRLITPTDPAGTYSGNESSSQSSDGVRYFQLTHDYLVPAIGKWITRRQRETRRGRAELRLVEYSDAWNSKPSRQFIPGWIDWLSIWLFSSPKRWSEAESRLMRATSRFHVTRFTAGIVGCGLLLAGSWYYQSHRSAQATVRQLQTVSTAELPGVLAQIRHQDTFTMPLVKDALQASAKGGRREWLNRLALLPSDSQQRNRLIQQHHLMDLPMLMILGEQLGELTSDQRHVLLTSVNDSETELATRLRSAILIASASKDPPKLDPAAADAVVQAMLQHAQNWPQDSSLLISVLPRLSQAIEEPLVRRVVSRDDSPERSLATSFAVQFLKRKPAELLKLFLDSSFAQQTQILSVLESELPVLGEQIRRFAATEVDTSLDAKAFDREARRKGIAASLLHRLGEPELTWKEFQHQSHPDARSYMIHRIGALGGDMAVLLTRFAREPDPSVRRGILHAIAQYEPTSLPPDLLAKAIAVTQDAFVNDLDAGVHSAAQSVLVSWDQDDWLAEEIKRQSRLSPDARKNWYVNAEGHTMAILDGRAEPRIGRVFAISTSEVTVEQGLRFMPDLPYYKDRSPTPDSPVGMLNWYRATAYCRWLSKELRVDSVNSYPANLSGSNPDVPCDHVVESAAYRLPTIAEWAFACRSFTQSTCYFGGSDRLTQLYCIDHDTSQRLVGNIRYFPAGTRLPNDFGMFNMLDGVREWCHDAKGDRRVIAGHSTNVELEAMTLAPPQDLKQAAADLPKSINGYYGMRLARTIKAPVK